MDKMMFKVVVRLFGVLAFMCHGISFFSGNNHSGILDQIDPLGQDDVDGQDPSM